MAVAAFNWCRPHMIMGPNFVGEPPGGMRYCTDFVTTAEESELMRAVDSSEWSHHVQARPQKFYGTVYYHTTQEITELQPSEEKLRQGAPLDELPNYLLPRLVDTGVFPRGLEEITQVAANDYRGPAGIAPHVEDPTCFGDNLATLSLLSSVMMSLTRAGDQSGPIGRANRRTDGQDDGNWIKVLLEPRSLLVFQGESRWEYKHGIRRSRTVFLRDGTELRRGDDYRRVSLTFRELLPSRRCLSDAKKDLWQQERDAKLAPADSDS